MIFEETFSEKGKQISYIRYGNWTNNIILFFHGFTGSKRFIPEIQKNNEVCILSFDRPGIGNSSINEYYKIEDFLNSIYKFIANRNINGIHLIGHSAGGYYAQVFLEMYPERVKSLSLLNSIVPLNCSETKELLNNQWKIIKFLTLHNKFISKLYFMIMASKIKKNYKKYFQLNLKTLSPCEEQFMYDNYDFIKQAIISAVANDGLGVFYDAYALCQKRDLIEIKNNIPVHIWWGNSDNMIPLNFVKYLEKKYKNSEVHIIENIGHMLYLIEWENILLEILKF